jgi:hypothetical protein
VPAQVKAYPDLWSQLKHEPLKHWGRGGGGKMVSVFRADANIEDVISKIAEARRCLWSWLLPSQRSSLAFISMLFQTQFKM